MVASEADLPRGLVTRAVAANSIQLAYRPEPARERALAELAPRPNRDRKRAVVLTRSAPLPHGRGSEWATPALTENARLRRAFTLTELVVSIGLLALMMLMAGAVFKITLDSTGQASALTDINQELRVLEETLRQDLAQTPRDGAVLVIQANRINAFWTRQTAEANSPGTDPDPLGPDAPYVHASDPEREDASGRMLQPRADMLMTFAAQPVRSFLCPDIVGQVQQVVYGHAEVGELDSAGVWVGGAAPKAFLEHLAGTGPAVFATPAEEWHLARRSVLIVDGIVPPPCDVLVDAALDVSGSGEPTNLLEGRRDIVARNSGTFTYYDDVVRLTDLTGGVDLPDWFARSRMDLTPPALVGNRLGHHFLPHCASFKVEWALDLRRFDSIPFSPQPGRRNSAPQELVWFDPGRVNSDGTQNLFGELSDLIVRHGYTPPVSSALNGLRLELLARFRESSPTSLAYVGTEPVPTQTLVWYANDAPNNGGGSGSDEPDRYFPDALRITVDLYDANKKLERPIRHVMVLPVGR